MEERKIEEKEEQGRNQEKGRKKSIIWRYWWESKFSIGNDKNDAWNFI